MPFGGGGGGGAAQALQSVLNTGATAESATGYDVVIRGDNAGAHADLQLDSHNNGALVSISTETGAANVLDIDTFGDGSGFVLCEDSGTERLRVLGTGTLEIKPSTGNGALSLYSGGAPGTLSLVMLADGALAIAKTTAPADGDLGASQVALWFDATNGVGNTKLMLKGKSADGTVKTASIVLA